MKTLLASLLALGLTSATAVAQDAATTPASSDAADAGVKQSIRRGLDFLARDAIAWRDEHKCASCHHAALVVWALTDAKQAGFAVNADVLAEMTTWLTQAGTGKTSVPRPADVPRALNTRPVFYALGLAAVPQPSETIQSSLKLLRQTILEDQLDTGAWAAWPETRPPMFGPSDASMSTLALLALQSGAANDETLRTAVDKGTRWLEQAPLDGELQSLAMKLLLWTRLNRPASDLQPLIAQINQRQQPDGGWSQAPGLTSDAWATGQALYALRAAGEKPTAPTLQRGREFLLKTQREDGSWPMTSRPTKPGGEGSMNLIPITGAGTAWGLLGLVRSL